MGGFCMDAIPTNSPATMYAEFAISMSAARLKAAEKNSGLAQFQYGIPTPMRKMSAAPPARFVEPK